MWTLRPGRWRRRPASPGTAASASTTTTPCRWGRGNNRFLNVTELVGTFNQEKALVEHQTSRRLDSSCSLHVVCSHCSQWSSSPNICSDIIITAIARHLIHRKCCCLAAINLHFVMHFVFGVFNYFHTLPPLYPLCKFYASQLSVIQILIL